MSCRWFILMCIFRSVSPSLFLIGLFTVLVRHAFSPSFLRYGRKEVHVGARRHGIAPIRWVQHDRGRRISIVCLPFLIGPLHVRNAIGGHLHHIWRVRMWMHWAFGSLWWYLVGFWLSQASCTNYLNATPPSLTSLC